MTHPLRNGNEDAGEPKGAAAAKPAARRGGLGRGLSALIPHAAREREQTRPQPTAASRVPDEFLAGAPAPALGSAPNPDKPDTPGHGNANGTLRVIPLRAISLNPEQPRKEFKREELDDLAASIKEHGILQPIAVRIKEGGNSRDHASYELIAGERRFRAASTAGLAEIPALVRMDVGARESLVLAIIENVQREDLNVIEAAQGYDELLHAYNMTQTELAQTIGKSQPQIANSLRMLNLPAPIQESLRASGISEGHAKVILTLKSEPEQTVLWNEIVQQGLTVRSAEKRAAMLRAAAPAPAPARAASNAPRPAPADADGHYAELGQKLSLSLGTRVRLVPGKDERGAIEISYFDHDQLEDLLDKLGA